MPAQQRSKNKGRVQYELIQFFDIFFNRVSVSGERRIIIGDRRPAGPCSSDDVREFDEG